MSSLVKHKPAVMTAAAHPKALGSNDNRCGGAFAPRLNGANDNRPREEADRQE